MVATVIANTLARMAWAMMLGTNGINEIASEFLAQCNGCEDEQRVMQRRRSGDHGNSPPWRHLQEAPPIAPTLSSETARAASRSEAT
jgi:hypothetical protein